ncbi:MAG TPA: TetR/AcrR family transcriptional regulator [Solirubrobacterales bacterium]|nr:TetR/AcrR family transcriptional regulator [Solirubrobacterales bacterium]
MTPQPETTAPAEPIEADVASRRRLLDGLAQAIREKGLKQTNVADIVRNARMSKRTFYECFSEKEECLAALAEDWIESLHRMVEAAVDVEAPWDVQVDAVIDAFIAAVNRDPALARALTRELPVLSGPRYALWEKDVDLYAELYMELSRGPMMRQAGIQPLSADKAIILIGGLAELIDRYLRAGRSLTEAAPAMKEAAKQLIGPPVPTSASRPFRTSP